MLEFDGDWRSSVSLVERPVPASQEVEVRVSCAKVVSLYGRFEGGKWVMLHSEAGSWRVRAKFNFDHLRLQGDGKHEFGYRFRDMDRTGAEPVDDSRPADPPLPGKDNILLQVRRIMRQEFERNRAPYLEPEELPYGDRYVIDEDDERFEEEIAAEQRRETKPRPKSPGLGGSEPLAESDQEEKATDPPEKVEKPSSGEDIAAE